MYFRHNAPKHIHSPAITTILIYLTALRVMPPARLRRTPVPHGGNPQDRTGSPSRQERQENLDSA
jgi:hypothetical protein